MQKQKYEDQPKAADQLIKRIKKGAKFHDLAAFSRYKLKLRWFVLVSGQLNFHKSDIVAGDFERLQKEAEKKSLYKPKAQLKAQGKPPTKPVVPPGVAESAVDTAAALIEAQTKAQEAAFGQARDQYGVSRIRTVIKAQLRLTQLEWPCPCLSWSPLL